MRIEALTFFRFIAAFIVVVFHFGRETELANLGIRLITAGPQMVTFFFALSGFVMLVAHSNKPNETLRNYYVSRIARIAPVYLLSYVLLAMTASIDMTPLILSLTFTQAWIPPYPLIPNAPAWSLSVEMFFYLTFPLILFIINKYKVKTVTLVIFTLLIYIITQTVLSKLMVPPFYKGFPSVSHDLIYYFPLSHYCSFLIGVSGGVVYIRNIEFFNNKGLVQLALFLAASVLTYYLFQYPEFLSNLIGHPLAYGSSFYSLLFIILILSIASSKNMITRILSLGGLVFLGEISYSLYILQRPIYNLYKKYISSNLTLDVNNDFYLFVVILTAISAIVYLVLEKPSKKAILKFNKHITRTISNKSYRQTAEAAAD